MKFLTSDALTEVDRALGLSGPGTPQPTFADGELVQTLDVSALVRRGRTLAGTTGLFHCGMRNIHAAADSQSSTIDVYNTGVGINVDPYPNPVPHEFDVWLIGCGLRRISGTGTVTASFGFDWASGLGFAINQAGAFFTPSGNIPLVFWDTVVTAINVIGQSDDGTVFRPLGIRVPRTMGGATELIFISTASAIATYDCNIIVGLFPVGLGQDGVQL